MINYKNFILTITQNGCIIRDSHGKFICMTPTENEAYEYIDNI